MEANCTYVPYAETGFFSKIVLDYLQQHEQLTPFYLHPPSVEGLQAAIENRRRFPQNREVLAGVLDEQYRAVDTTAAVKQNIQLLRQENSYTLTTAHQPNIFTGPLYFIYKILHTIRLAAYCAEQFPGNHFIPVFYMGSEDADLDELGNITLEGKRYEWKTKQTGAVGRMKVDKAFLSLLAEMEGQLGVLPHASEIIQLFRAHYTEGVLVQQATLGVVNALFGQYGLLVIIPDDARLKQLFQPVLQKELLEGFSHTAVAPTLEALDKYYKVQAGGRELNLFYLLNDKRERIEKKNGRYEVPALQLAFDEAGILEELAAHPERFSPNVILRGVFQETILPNIAFIGGGGELAYWLELKQVFAAAGVPYPVLLLRNSFLLVEKKWQEKLERLGITLQDSFKPAQLLMNDLVQRHSKHKIGLNGELDKVKALYKTIEQSATEVDASLQQHVMALQTRAVQKLEELEKKMLRAEKRKFVTEQRQLEQVKAALFPGDSLQERVENIAGFYAKYGRELLDVLLQYSPALEARFGMLTIG
jgi:bacillithiol biosynthesis cysteine-adding enzyme BshC